ncbi:hypothetical protein [Streptomyces sp. 150FB]|uniref:hypothetical protein n=1 Tax=Streptomyces sp. 150FB TaxID=1576605 RepID=UPI000A74BAA6|nr:hypothetical protein [Streptomyces sp. 150FB]
MAVALLPLLAACGGNTASTASTSASGTAGAAGTAGTTKTADGVAQLTVPDGADEATKQTYIVENTLASCMKKKGFTYTPHVATAETGDSAGWADGEDYALAKKSRQKYGFGNYAPAVYPDDPNAPFSRASGRVSGKAGFTSDDDEKGFTPAQLKAYEVALSGPPAKSKWEEKIGGCEATARAAAYGPPLSAAAEKKKEDAQTEQNRANGLELNGDTQLVQLAQQFAACLTAQGIEVSTTQPTGMVDMVRLDQDVPENHFGMSKEAALPLLTKEIDISLKDLECGRKFRAAYFPKEKAHPYYGEDA